MKANKKTATKIEFTLYTLDVWGNEKDGYEINDSFGHGSIYLPENYTHKDLLDAIDEKIGLTDRELAEIEDDGEFIEVRDKTNQCPVFHLYYVQDGGE